MVHQPFPEPASAPDGRRSADDALTIDCDECAHQGTASCRDCVVTFLCDRSPGDAVTIDLAEERALRALEVAGLVPGLRHVPRSG